MNDIESARTGYTKLYHPRGPLVSLPVVGDNPAAMFACVTAMLDAGFVVAAPGLEVGEERETVSAVLRSTFEHDGEVTDTILLYAANEALEFSFLKLYLNSDADVQAFEAACGVKLDSLLVYDGKDKPKRDGSSIAKKYIVSLPRPVPVVFKQNPKWIEEDAKAALAANKPYIKPKRVFVRWADAAPVAAQEQSAPPTQAHKPSELDVAVEAWKVRLANVIGTDDLNKTIPMVKAIADESIRKKAWTMCLELADARKWVLDKNKQIFRDAVEMTAAPVAAPPKASVPPPPDDAVEPLIAEWQKKLDPETVNLPKLNGEILAGFKSIPKSSSLRGDVWVMIVEFANKHGCEFDTGTMKFVDKMP